MSKDKPVSAIELFEQIAQFVNDSRSLLSQGAMIEMAGLDKQVQALCAQVLTLTQDDRLKYADLLQDLLSQLQNLGEELQVQKEAITNEIRYLSSHKKANAAYQSADATDGFGPKDDDNAK